MLEKRLEPPYSNDCPLALLDQFKVTYRIIAQNRWSLNINGALGSALSPCFLFAKAWGHFSSELWRNAVHGKYPIKDRLAV